MEVVKLILSKWSYLEVLQEVCELDTILVYVSQNAKFKFFSINLQLFCIGGSLASDELYLLDLRNGD